MFLSRNKEKNVYPYKPQFYYIKVGFKGSKLYRPVFVMRQKLMKIGCCVLKTRRLGAQEAAYRLSDLKLTHSNIEILSVNIKKPEKRYWILKSKKRQGKTSKIF